jgi:23S rRNA (cytosine1962-C5)-methyltransferase
LVVLFFGYRYGDIMQDTSPHYQSPHILTPEGWHDYQLLDSGYGRKLESVGGYRFIRPEPQAFWAPFLSDQEWQNPAGVFITGSRDQDDGGKWELDPALPDEWTISYEGVKFNAMPTPFRHFGFFPEQSSHWQWCDQLIRTRAATAQTRPNILNLFAYTGVASLHAARAGAEVTHVDSSKKAIAQAFANRDIAQMQDAPIRFITEDVRRFVAREARRGKQYDGIILDPPKYGRGVKGEIWRMEDDILDLLTTIRSILSDQPLFIVLTSYAIRASFLSLHHIMADMMRGKGGRVTSGELAITETRPASTSADFSEPRQIGQANFARWQAGQD